MRYTYVSFNLTKHMSVEVYGSTKAHKLSQGQVNIHICSVKKTIQSYSTGNNSTTAIRIIFNVNVSDQWALNIEVSSIASGEKSPHLVIVDEYCSTAASATI